MAMNLSSITLRPFKLSDVDDFMLVAGDDRVNCYTRRDTFVSREQALTFIRDVCMPHPWTRSISVEDKTIGYVSVTVGSDEAKCRAEIGYAIAAKYWGQGFGTKALKMAVSQVFKDFPHLVRIEAFVVPQNKASQRVLEKVGFLKEGVLRKYAYVKGSVKDVVVFSLVLEDTHLQTKLEI
ncbi:uncharacterized protein LOC113862051 [Abrus precatorius]|uniref:Uncharacterized protein LOC113862051 n=1 Tax=Abrus precatorius TaxID=3816 RepID=A0A8B8L494_ABRPR|nr:uncharacterized protein LOC113862051 [Abrus precatorius]